MEKYKSELLFKRSSTGKLQQWQIFAEGDQFYTVSGQVDGKLTTSKPTTTKAKNVGRSNETTPEEQAVLEAKAKCQKKLDSGYTTDITKVDEARAAFFKPMKAQEYIVRRGWDKKQEAYVKPDKVEFPCLMQPKFDGIRMIAQKGSGLSRNGKPLGGAFNVLDRLQEFFEAHPEAILDGELYNHDFKEDFNELVSLIKKQKPNPERAEEIKKYVKYYVYDCPRIGTYTEEDTYQNRMDVLKYVLNSDFPELKDIVKLVPCNVAGNHDAVQEVYQHMLDLGYEGAMIRYDKPYESDRKTWNLLKVKPFYDDEFELVDVEEGTGDWAGIAKRAIIRLEDGKLQGAGLRGKQPFLKDKLENKDSYIGKTVTVVYQGFTPDDKLRFPVVKAWAREDVE